MCVCQIALVTTFASVAWTGLGRNQNQHEYGFCFTPGEWLMEQETLRSRCEGSRSAVYSCKGTTRMIFLVLQKCRSEWGQNLEQGSVSWAEEAFEALVWDLEVPISKKHSNEATPSLGMRREVLRFPLLRTCVPNH